MKNRFTLLALGLLGLCAPQLASGQIYRLNANDYASASFFTEANSNAIITGLNATATEVLDPTVVGFSNFGLLDSIDQDVGSSASVDFGDLTVAGETILNGVISGANVETTLTDDDTTIPTSGAVADYVAAETVSAFNSKAAVDYLIFDEGFVVGHDVDFASDFSIAVLYRKTGDSITDPTLISKFTGGVGWYMDINAGATLRAVVSDGSNTATAEATVAETPDGWVLAVFTADRDGNLTLYANGTEVDSADMSSVGAISNIAHIIAGSDNDGVNYFDGDIAHVQPYNLVLTAAQAATLDITEPNRWGVPQLWGEPERNGKFTDGTTTNWTGVSGTTAVVADGADTITFEADAGGKIVRISSVSARLNPAPVAGDIARITVDVSAIDLDGADNWRFVFYDNSTPRYSVDIDGTGIFTSTIAFTSGTAGSTDQIRCELEGSPTTLASIEFNSIDLEIVGCVADMPMRGAGYQVHDYSPNQFDGTMSETGATWSRVQPQGFIRGAVSWSGTHEAKNLLASQRLLPDGARVSSISVNAVGGTIEDIIVGDGTDADRWVAVTSGLTTDWRDLTLANRWASGTTDAVNEVAVDPDANATATYDFVLNFDNPQLN